MVENKLYSIKDFKVKVMNITRHCDLCNHQKIDLINGSTVKAGDRIIGIASSGFHSNGYSLVRKLINEDETELKQKCLTPTKIYVKSILALLKNMRGNIKGVANITGGGVHNIPRMNQDFGYHLTNLPMEIPEEIKILAERSGLDKAELYKTFNMGIGMAIVTDRPDEVQSFLDQQGEKAFVLGTVGDSFKGVKF